MKKENGESNEKRIWEMYEKLCKEEGTEPSVQGFKEWTISLLRKLK